MQSFRPSPRYLTKLRLIISIIAALVLAGGVLIAIPVGVDEGERAGWIVAFAFLGADVLWWLPAMILAGPYYRSLRYEIQDDEVIVHVGIWTKSVKHVPYRTVTNMKINRGILDRSLFGIGTLNIQTAGMSGATGAEESLVGLENYQGIYEIVVSKLRHFRGGMGPTAAEEEDQRAMTSSESLREILEEVRAIRQAMRK